MDESAALALTLFLFWTNFDDDGNVMISQHTVC